MSVAHQAASFLLTALGDHAGGAATRVLTRQSLPKRGEDREDDRFLPSGAQHT